MTSPWKPVPKVTAAALGGAVATLLVWATNAVSGISVPPEAAAALTALVAFAFGYIKAPAGTNDTEDGYSLVEVMVAAFFAVLIVLVLVRLL